VLTNTVLRLDAALAVSQMSETVTVSAAAVTLQTDRADINNVIRSSQITPSGPPTFNTAILAQSSEWGVAQFNRHTQMASVEASEG